MNRTEHISALFGVFTHAARYSSRCKQFTANLGIDTERIAVGWINDRFHKSKNFQADEALLGLCIEMDIMAKAPALGYSIKDAGSVVFALKDSLGAITDLYIYNLDTETGRFANGGFGFFPSYPALESSDLTIVNDVITAAKMLSEQPSLNVLALHDGKMSEELKIFLRKNSPTIKLLWDDDIPPTTQKLIDPELPSEGNDYQLQINGEQIHFEKDGIAIEVVGGLDENEDGLQVTLKVYHRSQPMRSVRDSIDLYKQPSCEALIRLMQDKLHLEAETAEDLLDHLVYALERYKKQQSSEGKAEVKIPSARREEALAYLHQENLMQNLSKDLGNIGLVGEEINRLLAYIVMSSRKLDNPLHLVNYGSTGSGKSMLLEILGKCMPAEDVLELSSISNKAFFHFKENDICHKLILLQDLYDISDDVLYQIRELQSKHKLTRSVTVKTKSGGFETRISTVNGPICLIASTTSTSGIYKDNASRSIEIIMDESEAQSQLIMQRQRAVAAGEVNLEKERRTRLKLQNSQRLLQPYGVRIPFATGMQLPEMVLRKRRINTLYLGLIEAITLLHQYQREKQTDKLTGKVYLESSSRDIFWANKLIHHVLVHKADLLSPATRTFFEHLKNWVENTAAAGFTTREMVLGMRIPVGTIKRHLTSLHGIGLITRSMDSGSRAYHYRIADTLDFIEINENVSGSLDKNLDYAKQA